MAAIFKFKDEAEVVELVNNTVYGLATNVFMANTSRAIKVAHAVEAGTMWVCFFVVAVLFLSELSHVFFF